MIAVPVSEDEFFDTQMGRIGGLNHVWWEWTVVKDRRESLHVNNRSAQF